MKWMVGMIVDMIVKIVVKMIDNMPKCFFLFFTRNQKADKLSASLPSSGLKFSKKYFGGHSKKFKQLRSRHINDDIL